MQNRFARCLLSGLLFAAIVAWPGQLTSAQTPRPSVYQTTLEEPGQITPEISTETLISVLANNDGSVPVFDVRTAKEYAIAHIPGTINIYEKEVERIAELYPNRSTPMILYCNGPSCGKSKRTSQELAGLGYQNVRRYQLGLPVWRALSLTVQTDILGFDYIYRGDQTAVFVDSRTPAEYAAGTVPRAVNVQQGEATAANDDGRLPFTDKGTRIVVIGNTAEQSKVVAAEIAKRAYWNSSYFGGTFEDLLAAGFINHQPVAIGRNVTVAAGPTCSATVSPKTVDGGSFDPDSGDVATLSIDPAGPFGLGQHAVSLIATDRHGQSSASAALVTVADQSAPAIGDVTVDKPRLWPPNHRMELVTVAYEATDNCGRVSTELEVSSGGSRGAASNHRREPDWEVIDAHHVKLRAELDGDHDRTYRITVVATDASGNRSSRSVVVRVRARKG